MSGIGIAPNPLVQIMAATSGIAPVGLLMCSRSMELPTIGRRGR